MIVRPGDGTPLRPSRGETHGTDRPNAQQCAAKAPDSGTAVLMRSPSELAGFWSRVADLDAEICRCHADGYTADVDRLLDERAEWQQERDELFRGLPRFARRP
jgi:hypothetical protein